MVLLFALWLSYSGLFFQDTPTPTPEATPTVVLVTPSPTATATPVPVSTAELVELQRNQLVWSIFTGVVTIGVLIFSFLRIRQR